MEKSTIELKWSKLLGLKEEMLKDIPISGGVFRISRKELDGKYYVIYVSSTSNIKETLLELILRDKDGVPIKSEIDSGKDIKFRFALLEEEEIRKAVEKQMFKNYFPKYNLTTGEPVSPLEVKANLN